MTGGASDDRIDRLRSSLVHLRADLGNLIDVVDADPGGLARRHRLVLEVQVASLRELEQSLEGGILRRRTWSLAEAAVPVIRSFDERGSPIPCRRSPRAARSDGRLIGRPRRCAPRRRRGPLTWRAVQSRGLRVARPVQQPRCQCRRRSAASGGTATMWPVPTGMSRLHTFTDFIDVAQHLVDTGVTTTPQLVASGGSAGGLLMGAVLNMAPDLFGAIVANVAFVDVVTTMLDESIPLTTFEYDEWGNPNDKTFYDVMLSYSPYDNVAAADHPPVFALAGLHESQVQYWEPAKWVTKLRDTSTGDAPVILRMNMDAGHGGASGRFARLEEVAEEYAFMLGVVGGDL